MNFLRFDGLFDGAPESPEKETIKKKSYQSNESKTLRHIKAKNDITEDEWISYMFLTIINSVKLVVRININTQEVQACLFTTNKEIQTASNFDLGYYGMFEVAHNSDRGLVYFEESTTDKYKLNKFHLFGIDEPGQFNEPNGYKLLMVKTTIKNNIEGSMYHYLLWELLEKHEREEIIKEEVTFTFSDDNASSHVSVIDNPRKKYTDKSTLDAVITRLRSYYKITNKPILQIGNQRNLPPPGDYQPPAGGFNFGGQGNPPPPPPPPPPSGGFNPPPPPPPTDDNQGSQGGFNFGNNENKDIGDNDVNMTDLPPPGDYNIPEQPTVFGGNSNPLAPPAPLAPPVIEVPQFGFGGNEDNVDNDVNMPDYPPPGEYNIPEQQNIFGGNSNTPVEPMVFPPFNPNNNDGDDGLAFKNKQEEEEKFPVPTRYNEKDDNYSDLDDDDDDDDVGNEQPIKNKQQNSTGIGQKRSNTFFDKTSFSAKKNQLNQRAYDFDTPRTPRKSSVDSQADTILVGPPRTPSPGNSSIDSQADTILVPITPFSQATTIPVASPSPRDKNLKRKVDNLDGLTIAEQLRELKAENQKLLGINYDLGNRIDTLNHQIEEIKSLAYGKISDATKKARERANKDADETMKELNNTIDALTNNINGNNAILDANSLQIAEYKKQLDTLRQLEGEAREQIKLLQDALEEEQAKHLFAVQGEEAVKEKLKQEKLERRREVKELEDELKEGKETLQKQMDDDADEFNTATGELNDQIEELTETLDYEKNEVETLKDSLKTANREKEDNVKEIEKLTNSMDQLKISLKANKDSLEALKQKTEDEIKKLKAINTDNITAMENQQKVINDLNIEKQKAEGNLRKQRLRYNLLKQVKEALGSSNEKYMKENNNLITQVIQLQRQDPGDQLIRSSRVGDIVLIQKRIEEYTKILEALKKQSLNESSSPTVPIIRNFKDAKKGEPGENTRKLLMKNKLKKKEQSVLYKRFSSNVPRASTSNEKVPPNRDLDTLNRDLETESTFLVDVPMSLNKS